MLTVMGEVETAIASAWHASHPISQGIVAEKEARLSANLPATIFFTRME